MVTVAGADGVRGAHPRGCALERDVERGAGGGGWWLYFEIVSAIVYVIFFI